jgi:hypothetical protein
MDAINTASLALHGRVVGLASEPYGYTRPVIRLCLTMSRAWKKLIRTANNARKMVAKNIKKMQVPVYCPVEFGVQDVE